MGNLTRRDFLKLSSLFGVAALLPWREQFGVTEAGLDSEATAEAILAESVAPVDEVMADLTRVLLWLDGEVVQGVCSAELESRHDIYEPWIVRTELRCQWIGYSEMFTPIRARFELEEELDIALAMPYIENVLYRGKAQIWEYGLSLPRSSLGLKLKPKTLAEFHKFVQADILFMNIKSWSVEPVLVEWEDGL